MSNYTITTDFGAKDSLPSSNDSKVVRGSEFTTEFTSIQTAIATKADTAGDTFTGVVNFSADVAVNTNTLFVDVSEGKVGIGTASPAEKLHISRADVGTLARFATQDGTNNPSLQLSTTATGVKARSSFGTGIVGSFEIEAAGGGSYLAFSPNSTEAMRVKANGNVGIGTTSPDRIVHAEGTSVVFGDSRSVLQLADDTAMAAGVGGGLVFTGKAITGQSDSNTTFGAIQALKENGTSGNTASYMTFCTRQNGNNPSERMRIDSSGNVGIGTTSPAQKLHISGGSDAAIVRIQSDGVTRIDFGDNSDSDAGRIEYVHSAHAMRFSTDNTERMRIDSSGNVGIGTNSPDSALEVQGSVNGVHQIHIQNTFDDDDANDPNPSARLYLSAESNNAYIQCKGAPTDLGTQHEIDFGSTAAGSFITFSPASTERMRIDSTGNVGIGTSSPQSDGNTTNLEVSSANGARILVNNTDTSGRKYGFYSDNSGNFGLADYTADVTRMLVDSSGNVGIGTSSPATRLDVKSRYSHQNASNGAIRIRNHSVDQFGSIFHIAGTQIVDNATYYTGGQHLAKTTFSSNINLASGTIKFYANDGLTADTAFTPTERMRIDSSGSVLVGTTDSSVYNNTSGGNTGFVYSPNSFLQLARETTTATQSLMNLNKMGSDGNIIELYKNGTTVGSISVTTSATSYNTSSDERLKENIADSADAGSKVDAIQIRQFDWKADGSHQDYGVIAQELVEVAPEAVSEGDTEEDMMGVDYSKLVPMLIKEVQSLRSRVAELENA